MLRVCDVEARLRRLEELTRGLSREVSLWKEGNDPLLYLERRAYLNGVQDALAGVEAARVVLARAVQRLRAESRGAAPEGEPPAGAAGC